MRELGHAYSACYIAGGVKQRDEMQTIAIPGTEPMMSQPDNQTRRPEIVRYQKP
jgi:hypothetical protein